MHSREYEIGDVLLIEHKGSQVVGRVSSYEDSLDNTKPLYVNLRVSGGLHWGVRQVKIQPEQVIRKDETYYERQRDERFAASRQWYIGDTGLIIDENTFRVIDEIWTTWIARVTTTHFADRSKPERSCYVLVSSQQHYIILGDHDDKAFTALKTYMQEQEREQ